jgi:hypothetical protein
MEWINSHSAFCSGN